MAPAHADESLMSAVVCSVLQWECARAILLESHKKKTAPLRNRNGAVKEKQNRA